MSLERGVCTVCEKFPGVVAQIATVAQANLGVGAETELFSTPWRLYFIRQRREPDGDTSRNRPSSSYSL